LSLSVEEEIRDSAAPPLRKTGGKLRELGPLPLLKISTKPFGEKRWGPLRNLQDRRWGSDTVYKKRKGRRERESPRVEGKKTKL